MKQWLVVCLTVLFLPSVIAQPLRVAVASNFLVPAKQLTTLFNTQSSCAASLSAASSGKIFAQIQHGAPFDVFLSADQARPQQLIALGLAFADPAPIYAIGRLVLWQPENPNNLADLSVRLKADQQQRLAIANPRLAPYGLAAEQVLTNLGVAQQWQPHLVKGENISQTYQFVFSGAAPMGLVAWSQMVQANIDDAQFIVVPAHLHQPIKQQAVQLTQHPCAKSFVEFLLSDQAKKVIQAHGYEVAL